MNKETNLDRVGCQQCDSLAFASPDGHCCESCVYKGDLVASVVWNTVYTFVNEVPRRNRVTYMLTGLEAWALEGIARGAPNSIEGKTVLLKMSKNSAKSLNIDCRFTSDESPVHYRHINSSDVVIFAPSNEERDEIGASLGPVEQIDEQSIMDKTGEWASVTAESEDNTSYLKRVLDGLCAANICRGLRMWVDFVNAIAEQKPSVPIDTRVKRAMPALQIPIDGIRKLPTMKSQSEAAFKRRTFSAAFRSAYTEAGTYVGLWTPNHEPVDINAVREAAAAYDARGNSETKEALKAVNDLLDDAEKISPHGWRLSQKHFCEKVSWEKLGANLFGSKPRTTRVKLGERTLTFIAGNFLHALSTEDRVLLETMTDAVPRDPRKVEIDFFNRWKERLSDPREIKIFKEWQKRVFSNQVVGHDLISTFTKAFKALLAAGSTELKTLPKPRVLIRTTHHNMDRYWATLNVDCLRLFEFEIKTVRKLFGSYVLWDLYPSQQKTAAHTRPSSRAWTVQLEFYLVSADNLDDIANAQLVPEDAARVQAVWQPLRKKSEFPIALSLVDDIFALSEAAKNGDSLFRRSKFTPRISGRNKNASSTTLRNRDSFRDISQLQNGRTFVGTVNSDTDILQEMRVKLTSLESDQIVCKEALLRLRTAVDSFDELYKSVIVSVNSDPENVFATTLITEQAEAFGALCKASRLPFNVGAVGIYFRKLVSQIGVIASHGSENMAIITAWHPLRLAERQAKTMEVAKFVAKLLSSPAALVTDLEIEFATRLKEQSKWLFPEVAVVNDITMLTIENDAGYGLMVPAASVFRDYSALSSDVEEAAKLFVRGVRKYLSIHPHESANLSVAIFDSENGAMPYALAHEIGKLLEHNSDLQCELLISHRDDDRLRDIYRGQDAYIATQPNLELNTQFLPRIRISVKEIQDSGNDLVAAKPVDLVFLHGSFSRFAEVSWISEDRPASQLSSHFDPQLGRRPRNAVGKQAALAVGRYLTVQNPPRSVAEYQDMLYELSKEADLAPCDHGVLIRQVMFNSKSVIDLVTESHQLGEWVMSYDQIASRALIENCNVRIISDISPPDSAYCVTVSASELDTQLQNNLKTDLVRCCGLQDEEASLISDQILRDILQISGQKILSAAQYENASKEIIGLAVMRLQMEAALREKTVSLPMWISLDDYSGWFMSATEKIADAVAFAIDQDAGRFRILIQVGEAKFTSKLNYNSSSAEAEEQLRVTVDRFRCIFVDNCHQVSQNAWCSLLSDILTHHKGFCHCLPDLGERTSFLDSLAVGDVDFALSGEAVICVHDNHQTASKTKTDPDFPYVRRHLLTSHDIRETLKLREQDILPIRKELKNGNWHGSTPLRKGFVNKINTTEPFFFESLLPALRGTEEEPLTLDDISQTVESNVSKMTADESAFQQNEIFPKIQKDECDLILPPVIEKILKEISSNEERIDEKHQEGETVANRTREALQQFRMRAEFSELKIRLTPHLIVIGFVGNSTLTVEKVRKKISELLTTHRIEVIDVQPGVGEVLISVKRDRRALVPLASTWLRAPWPNGPACSVTSFLIGVRDDDGRLLHLNLSGAFAGNEEHGPHTLIAGETGSGKGILTQSLLLQIIAFNDPRDLELIIVDPKKGVDFLWLEGAPHMKNRSIITDVDSASTVLKELVQRMDQRYADLKSVGAANIEQFNQIVSSAEKMPRIFLVHDELGAWMTDEKDYREVVLSAVAHLGMKARAAGIHLILVTQRADVEAVPGRLRENMGNRLCLKVQSSASSRMVLETTGAENLLGRGHVACILPGQEHPPGRKFTSVQVPFAKPEDMLRLAEAAKTHWEQGGE